MIKVRGYRVNVTEVEGALLQHPHVKEAGVAAWDSEPGEKLLVGYVVQRQESALYVSELKDFLRTKLPDYMVPAAFVFLESLPLTNGKLDRSALPKPDKRRPDLKTPYVPPRTDLEKTLSRMWSEILSLNQVGIHDNFFDLGGHSVLGARVVSLIHEEFKFDLPVSEFFGAATIAELAHRIETAHEVKPGMGKKTWTYLCELQSGKDRKPVFIFPGGGGGEPEFFVYGFLVRHVGTEYPFYGLRARGADGILQPHKSVAQMADAYVEEIRAIQPEGPYFLVGECEGGATAYEAASQLSAQGQEVAMLVLMDVERPTLIKYLRWRVSRRLDRFWNETVRAWWQENYYIARTPYHLKHLGSLRLSQYPRYILGRMRIVLKPTKKASLGNPDRHEKAAVVLQAGATGKKLRHIEWVRENYRRTVRQFRAKPYDGHIELLVSENLHRHDSTLGWKDLALKGISMHSLPGDHWSYIRDHVAVAGAKLRECLERAERNRKS